MSETKNKLIDQLDKIAEAETRYSLHGNAKTIRSAGAEILRLRAQLYTHERKASSASPDCSKPLSLETAIVALKEHDNMPLMERLADSQQPKWQRLLAALVKDL